MTIQPRCPHGWVDRTQCESCATALERDAALARIAQIEALMACNTKVLQEMHDDDIETINRLKGHIKHIGNDALRTQNAELNARLAAIEAQEPIAYRFTENRGNGNTEFNYYGLDEVGMAYRDNCLEVAALYAAAGASPQPVLHRDALVVNLLRLTNLDKHTARAIADAAINIKGVAS